MYDIEATDGVLILFRASTFALVGDYYLAGGVAIGIRTVGGSIVEARAEVCC